MECSYIGDYFNIYDCTDAGQILPMTVGVRDIHNNTDESALTEDTIAITGEKNCAPMHEYEENCLVVFAKDS